MEPPPPPTAEGVSVPAATPIQYLPSDPTAGPSSVTLDSPAAYTTYEPSSSHQPNGNGAVAADYLAASSQLGGDPTDLTYNPAPPRGRGRGRGRGRPRVNIDADGNPIRGRPKGRPRGRGRGGRALDNDREFTTRSSTRLSRSGYGGGKVGTVNISLMGGGVKGGTGGTSASGRMTSFLGDYDRELDEDDDEPLEFEEQFILRVPKEVEQGRNGEVGLRDMIKGKGKGLEGFEFKFLDARRAAFKINGHTYASRLVDLPNIIEAQKTHDSRHLFKIADISQMLVVEKRIPDETAVPPASGNADEYIWPHGITPPLRHVRKRRFRKRLSRRAIEIVEEQVEELLARDEQANKVEADFVEMHPDPNALDADYLDYDKTIGWQIVDHEGQSEFGESEMYGDPGSVAPSQMEWGDEYQTGEGEADGEEGEEEGDYEDEDYDEDLAAALMEQMGGDDANEEQDESGSDEDNLLMSDDDGEGDDGQGGDEEQDDELAEKKAKIKQLASEIKALEQAIERKRAGFQGGNPIMMKRHEETIAGMQADITLKASARQAILDEISPPAPTDKDVPADGSKAGPSFGDAAAEAQTPGPEDGEGEGDSEDDLFGDDGEEDADAEGTDVDMDSPAPSPSASASVSASLPASTPASASGTPPSGDVPFTTRGPIQRVPSKLNLSHTNRDADAADGMDVDMDGNEEAGTEAESESDGNGDGGGEDDEDAEGEDAEGEEEEEHMDEDLFAMLNAADLPDEATSMPIPQQAEPVSNPPSQTQNQWGIEGGAGQRRLMEGVESDSEGSTSDSD